MPFDVFISHSYRDKHAADAVCHALEREGIRCWIAPRDLVGGVGWKGKVVEAIRGARVVVLIFSGEVNTSKQIRSEIDIAFEAERPILPFRIEAVEMSEHLTYCLAGAHWLDAMPPIEQHVGALVNAVRRLLEGGRPLSPGERVTEVLPAVGTRPAPDPEPMAGPAADPDPVAVPGPASEPGAEPWLAVGARRALVIVPVLFGLLVALTLGLSGPDVAALTRDGAVAFDAGEYDVALPLLQQAAEAGSAEAQGLLGRLYGNGWGVGQDYGLARQWFELSAQQGHPLGVSGLGFLYLTGNGVDADHERAVSLLQTAAEANDPRAQSNLAWAYETGTGVAADLETARRLYLASAEQGNTFGQCGAARMAVNGDGGPRDDSEAERWYRAAADQQADCGQMGMGFLHRYGYGVEASFDESMRWYELAAAQGSEQARDYIRDVQSDWVLGPLFVGAWVPVVGPDRREELNRLRAEGHLTNLRDFRRMRRLDVPFYDDASLFELEVGRGSGQLGVLTYIRAGDDVARIDGNSTQIHRLSQTAPIRIETVQQAVAFLRFFMGAVQGEDGVFMVVDGVDEVPWLATAAASHKTSVAGRIRRLAVNPSPSGGWQGQATIRYSNALFNTELWLKPDGMVEMLTDTPIGIDLPIQIDRFDDQGIRVRVGTAGG